MCTERPAFVSWHSVTLFGGASEREVVLLEGNLIITAVSVLAISTIISVPFPAKI
jgi:hypothetical protein